MVTLRSWGHAAWKYSEVLGTDVATLSLVTFLCAEVINRAGDFLRDETKSLPRRTVPREVYVLCRNVLKSIRTFHLRIAMPHNSLKFGGKIIKALLTSPPTHQIALKTKQGLCFKKAFLFFFTSDLLFSLSGCEYVNLAGGTGPLQEFILSP